mgnify:CR=1 FL=1
MEGKQPINLRPEDINFLNEVTKPLTPSEKPLSGAVVNGLYMAPNLTLAVEQQEALKEAEIKIRKHMS